MKGFERGWFLDRIEKYMIFYADCNGILLNFAGIQLDYTRNLQSSTRISITFTRIHMDLLRSHLNFAEFGRGGLPGAWNH